MSASQLLRILQSLPAGADDEICAIHTNELEASTIRSSRCNNPFLSDEENKKSNFWENPELESSTFENNFSNNQADEMFQKSTAQLFNKSTGFYIDKNSVEYELPELMVCYKERDFQVKDICIDEGIPNEVSTACISIPVSEDGDDMIEARLDPDFLKHEWLRPSYIADSREKMYLSTNLEDDVSTDSSNNFVDDVDQQALEGSEAGKLSKESGSEIHGNVAFYFDTRKPATYIDPCEAMNSDSIYELPLDTQSGVHHYHHDVVNHGTRYLGESSFSMAGVISELISCSRPITFSSGISVSNRSDSSATSTRSFAFPTLETDYNSSPVRMGKAERRRLRKQRGWGQCLLCCKFKLK